MLSNTRPVDRNQAFNEPKTMTETQIGDACNFEETDCDGWTIADSDFIQTKDRLKRVNATEAYQMSKGPKSDSSGNIDGHYLLLETNGEAADQTSMTAFVYSDELSNTDGFGCLSFDYYIYGPASGGVNVYGMAGLVDMIPLLRISGSQKDHWLTANINLADKNSSLKDVYKVYLLLKILWASGDVGIYL